MSTRLRALSAEFTQANNLRSFAELCITTVGYIFFVYVLYTAFVDQKWLAYIVFSIIAGLFTVKIFTLLHDCAHGSMFTSERLNTWAGRFFSLFITMPFASWKEEHEIHHGHVVDMEKIGHGDIPLLTIEQFHSKPKIKRVGYIIFRHPLFLLLVAPFGYFFLKARVPSVMTKRIIMSVLLTNIFVALIYIPFLIYFGFWVMLFVFAIPAYLGGMIGIALFYLQHNYPDSSWFKTDDWSHENAAIEGSSLIILPQPLEWFSHAIGYHHIHHLNSKVPGYRLRECYDAIEEFRTITPLNWKDTLSAFRLKFWSYEQNRLVSLRESSNLKT